MKRIVTSPRPNLAEAIARTGFAFAEDEGGVQYWDESAFYCFTLKQIEDDLESPTNEIAALCLELVERALVDEEMLLALDLPYELQDLARDSWKKSDKTLYGRFDLSYDGRGPAKLLEYNADTPTSLFESAVFQWNWMEDAIASGKISASSDQFNSIHDRLIQQWKGLDTRTVHFTAIRDIEDEITIRYLAYTAQEAGIDAITLPIDEIGDTESRFVDAALRPIDTLFKLYPWEWLVRDEFGRSRSMAATTFLEPAWKAMLSTKAILPVLWNMEPGHPNLLPACFAGHSNTSDLGESFVRKPCLSREGANVVIVEQGRVLEKTAGSYGGKYIDQALARLPSFDGSRPVIGSWVVGDRSCGIGIREGTGEITNNKSRFLPHIII